MDKRLMAMKGFRFYAWLGSFSLLAASVGAPVLADEPVASPAAPTDVTSNERNIPLDQLSKYMDKNDGKSDAHTIAAHRSIALDELFKQIQAGKPKPVPTLAAAPPKEHTASVIAHQHHHLASKPAASGATKPTQAAGAKDNVEQPDQVAVYHGDGGNMMAVSASGLSDGGTAVVEASLDRPGQTPTYKSGDRMVIKLKARKDCNVLVFDFDNHGNLTKLYPNDYEQDGTLHAGQSVELGGEKSEYTLDIDGNGLERIFVYASPAADGPITVAMAPVPNTPFRAVNMSAENFDRLVNESKSFTEFDEVKQAGSNERSVHVTAKNGAAQQAAYTSSKANNKVELVFKITK